MARERWKQIRHKGRLLNYEVSDCGNVRNRTTRQTLAIHIVRGRHYVNLYLSSVGKQKLLRLTPLVATAFLGRKPPGKTIEHKDQRKTNDKATNLAYMTLGENIRRSYRLTKHRNGYCKLLSQKSYDLINQLWATGKHSQVRIGLAVGLTAGMVSKIVRGKHQALPHGTLDLTVNWDVLNAPRKKPRLVNLKLSDEQVLEILAAKGHESTYSLGKRYGVSRIYVQAIWQGIPSRVRRLTSPLSN